MAEQPTDIVVQVGYATPARQFLRELRMPPGATLQDAIRQSGLLEEMPELELATARVGIHGKLKTLDTTLRHGDRIEVYRSLIADPKETRRRRAQKEGVKKAR
jgi:putative ubiquitin-RnfH superfamily antitoxin RatB of RatAB toxin-antitoxin module